MAAKKARREPKRYLLTEDEKKEVIKAVEDGDCAPIQKLIKNKRNLNQPLYRYGSTALHIAAVRGRSEVVRVLVQGGADVDVQDERDWTPLEMAAWHGHTDTAEVLLSNKASVDVRDKEGRTPLYRAAVGGRPQAVKLLLANKASVDIRGAAGLTPLYEAAERGDTQTVELLLANKATVDVRDKVGRTPLHRAAGRGHTDTVKVLLANKASVDVRDEWRGNTPLHEASMFGRLAVVELLVQNNVDATILNKHNKTALDVCGNECDVFFNKVEDETIEKIKKVLEMHIERQSVKLPPSDVDADENPTPVDDEKNVLLAALKSYLKSEGQVLPVGVVDVVVQVKSKDDGTMDLLSVDPKLMEYFPLIVPVKQSGLLGMFPDRGENVISAHLHTSLTIAISSIVLLARPDIKGVGSGFRVGTKYVMTNYHVFKILTAKASIEKSAAIFHFNKSLGQCVEQVSAIPFLALVAYDPELDVAVLELDVKDEDSPLPPAFNNFKPINIRSLPPPLKKFRPILQQEQLHFVGHPEGDQKVVEIHCRVVLKDSSEEQKTITDLKTWAHKNFHPGFEAFPGIEDQRRTLYRTSSKFGKGSSGSPGFVPDDLKEACVAVIQTRGFPELPPSHYVSEEQIKARSVEQGVRIEAVYDFLSDKHPALCKDIFGDARPS